MDMQNLELQFDELKSQVEALNKKTTENKLSMIVFSGDLDKVLAAFVIATGAVAMGMEVVMFFTFWGTPVLRDKKKNVGGKDMGGMGTAMMKSLMKKKNVASLEEMLALAEELGVRIYVCEMSMDLMGFKREEIIEYEHLGFAGVATFLQEAQSSKVQLFI